jgi:hypothetical protein
MIGCDCGTRKIENETLVVALVAAEAAVRVKLRQLAPELRRRVSAELHVKQYEDAERDIVRVLSPLFVEQIRSIGDGLLGLEERSAELRTKTSDDQAETLVDLVFDPKAWHDRLVDLLLPVMAENAVRVGYSYLLSMGLDVRKKNKENRDEMPVSVRVDGGGGRVVGVYAGKDGGKIRQEDAMRRLSAGVLYVQRSRSGDGDSDGRIKTSTASEWLNQNPDDLDALTEAMSEAGLPIRLTTEMPVWMKRAIARHLTKSFRQDYWAKIHETTAGDATRFVRQGLREGWSIDKIARKFRHHFQGDGNTLRYARMRSENIARTETGYALNSVRKSVNDQLKEEMGPEVPMKNAWLSVLMNTTRGTHADLDGVPEDENGLWNLAGYMIPVPGHYTLPPEERCNCHCSIVIEFGMRDEESLDLIQQHEDRIAEREKE